MVKKKSWREKLLDSRDLPKVVTISETAQKHWNGKTMAIPSPMEVNNIMRTVPKGKLITIGEIRNIIAKKHRADIGCPLTCGIFSWIAAHAAKEAAAAGEKDITPYWRTLKTHGELNPKYPGGVEEQKKTLELEGHNVIKRGKKLIAENYDKYLFA